MLRESRAMERITVVCRDSGTPLDANGIPCLLGKLLEVM